MKHVNATPENGGLGFPPLSIFTESCMLGFFTKSLRSTDDWANYCIHTYPHYPFLIETNGVLPKLFYRPLEDILVKLNSRFFDYKANFLKSPILLLGYLLKKNFFKIPQNILQKCKNTDDSVFKKKFLSLYVSMLNL